MSRHNLPGAVIPGTAIRIITGKIARIQHGQIKCLLWDWDGNFSLLRQGWQGIMAPVMVESICGDSGPTPEIRQAVTDFIAETTGIRTIEQMRGLVRMIREYGLVPESQIGDEWHYKRVYLERLMVPVRERIALVESEQVHPRDMMLAGAFAVLPALARTGVTQLAFSGTDEENVVHEAGVLGAVQYFERIFGAAIALAPGQVERDKGDVLAEELQRRGLEPSEVAGGGDGPVEVRVLAQAGALSIGVASNEEQGRGWDFKKAEKLVAAGADVIMPDWRWYRVLIKHVLQLQAV